MVRFICIKEWLGKSPPETLVIVPLINGENQISGNAVDIHLDGKFIELRIKHVIGLDKIINKEIVNDNVNYQEKIEISHHEGFVIYPYQFIIGSSLEYIHLPYNLMAYVISRSSLCRNGLVIHATRLPPGFSGNVTFELCNHGEIPIILRRGIKIAELVFYNINGQSVNE